MRFYLDKVNTLEKYIYLEESHWDDYGYRTTFTAYFYNNGVQNKIGVLGIGMVGLEVDDYKNFKYTKDHLMKEFMELDNNFFSLGTEDYYRALNLLETSDKVDILLALKDVVYNKELLKIAEKESSFNISLTRSISNTEITGRFSRLIKGELELSNYKFEHKFNNETLLFEVKPYGQIPSNIHAVIGSNGVGKTTLLKSILNSFNDKAEVEQGNKPVNVVYCSFSIFDNIDLNLYKDNSKISAISLSSFSGKINEEINKIFNLAYDNCQKENKKLLLKRLYEKLSENPSLKGLKLTNELKSEEMSDDIKERFESFSSGHKVIVLTITKLVEIMEEKTLLLFDEPEVHLHPTLLSTLISTIGRLLKDRNAMAILATHSPVVLQEIPNECIYRIRTIDMKNYYERLDVNTLGENLGRLTKEVFSYEFSKSGIYYELEKKVEDGLSIDEIISEYDNKLGSEAISMAMALIYSRDSECQK